MSGQGTNSSDDSNTDDVQTNTTVPSGYKVLGETDGIDTAGVVGRTTSGSGEVYGVVGETNSDDLNAMGILAKAQNTHALEADARGGDGNGVRAYSDSSYYSIYAVHTGTGSDGSRAIWAGNQVATAPAVEAVANRFGSDLGIGVRSDGHMESTGHVDASEGYRGPIGSSAYLDSNWTIPSTLTKAPFNQLHADQRNEFSTSDNWFECAYDGAYQVEITLESASSSTGVVDVDLIVDQGSASSNPASSQGFDYDFESNDLAFTKSYSKTIYGLKAGNRLWVEMADSNGDQRLTGRAGETHFGVRQVGGGGQYTSSPTS